MFLLHIVWMCGFLIGIRINNYVDTCITKTSFGWCICECILLHAIYTKYVTEHCETAICLVVPCIMKGNIPAGYIFFPFIIEVIIQYDRFPGADCLSGCHLYFTRSKHECPDSFGI